jgi:hypothetical protein
MTMMNMEPILPLHLHLHNLLATALLSQLVTLQTLVLYKARLLPEDNLSTQVMTDAPSPKAIHSHLLPWTLETIFLLAAIRQQALA